MQSGLLELLAQHESVALAVTDAEGRMTLTSPALERMVGRRVETVTADEMASLDLWDASQGVPLSADELPLPRALRGEVVVDQVLSLRRDDGQVVYLRCSAAPVRDVDAAVVGAISLVQDVTSDWRAARKQEELRNRLLATVNHELRTPLTKILGHGELLSDPTLEQELPPLVLGSVQAIVRATKDLARLAQRITDLSDLEAATRVEASPVDLVDLVADQVATVRESSPGLDVCVSGPEGLSVEVDPHHVSWALRELLDNAVRHSTGTRVSVCVRTCDDLVEVSVADDGRGIRAEDRDRVVRPFERGLDSDPSASSHGLGLAVVSAVAAAHGGGVTLHDAEPQGLVARLRLRRHP